MKPTRILVTGASGFLGSHIMHLSDPAEAIGVFHANRPPDDGYAYQQADLADNRSLDKLFASVRPDIVIHAAAQSNLDWCEQQPDLAWQINAEAPAKLAKLCAETGCKFLHVSSDMVFDGEKGEYTENEPTNPIGLYGKAKAAAEQGVLSENPDAIIARAALIYGLPVAPGRGSSFLTWVLDRLENNAPVPLYYDQFRTPVEVGELAETLLQLAQSTFKGTIHVAGQEKVDRLTFGKYVCQATGHDEKLLKKTTLSEDKNIARRPRDLSLRTDLLQRIISVRLSDCRSSLHRILQKR